MKIFALILSFAGDNRLAGNGLNFNPNTNVPDSLRSSRLPLGVRRFNGNALMTAGRESVPGAEQGLVSESFKSALEFDRMIMAWYRSHEGSKRSGRNFSAWIGLAPNQHSSGGRDRLGSGRPLSARPVHGRRARPHSLCEDPRH